MMPLLVRFAAASGGCLLLGLVLAGLLRQATRRWPALAAHRTVWLACQAALLLAFLLALAPLPRAALAPALTLPVPEEAAEPAPTDHADDDDGAAQPARATPASMAAAALPWLTAAWLAVYAGGLATVLLRRRQAARRWNETLRSHVRPLAPHGLGAWPGAGADQVRRIALGRLAVATTDLPLSPMLLGVLRPCLLLPAQLDGFDTAQRTLILEHELTHWRRRDPLWLAASSCIASLLWFNPACRRLDAGLREAVELGCDDMVLAGRPQAERRGYAAALVAQLRQQHAGCAAPAFGQLGVAARVARMRDARPARLSGRARWTLAASALTLAMATAGLQPTLSIAALPAVPAAAPPVALAAPAPDWRYPLRDPRVTALYGVRSAYTQVGHHGVDFGARRGTPVLAVAAGSVSETGADAAWGNWVRIDHGAGRQSLMMHLDRIDVATGQQVAAGQVVGAAGATGKATGPHLHLEYWQDGRRLDPALMLAGLDAHATPRALARRAAQGYPQPTGE